MSQQTVENWRILVVFGNLFYSNCLNLTERKTRCMYLGTFSVEKTFCIHSHATLFDTMKTSNLSLFFAGWIKTNSIL